MSTMTREVVSQTDRDYDIINGFLEDRSQTFQKLMAVQNKVILAHLHFEVSTKIGFDICGRSEHVLKQTHTSKTR